LIFAVLAVGIVAVGASSPTAVTPVFSSAGTDWMPAATEPAGLTGTWFCPGVPATGEEGVGGEIVVSNSGDVEMRATVSLLGDPGTSVQRSIAVAPWSRSVVDVDEALNSRIVAAVVEIDGGGGVVEQRAVHPAGDAVAACANSTSASWYLADGFTVDASGNQLVLTNPHQDPAIVDIGFATVAGSRSPPAFQGFPVPARSVQVIDLAEAGARSEPLLAVRVEATRGRLVVGRAQHFLGGGRGGFTMSLASPALRDQWWFADGDKGPGVSERFSLYNPTDDDVDVDVIFLGIDADPQVDPIVVPARQVVAFEPGEVATLPEGPHAVVFGTAGCPRSSSSGRSPAPWTGGHRPPCCSAPRRAPTATWRRSGAAPSGPTRPRPVPSCCSTSTTPPARSPSRRSVTAVPYRCRGSRRSRSARHRGWRSISATAPSARS
jgi:hypothetical protein